MHPHVHLVGIGGIGISALAQLYAHRGYRVSGTNDSESPRTLDRVRALGVPVSLSRAVEDVPKDVDFFVYSDAWTSKEPAFMQAVRALGKPMFSYFEALGEATKEGKSVVVSGTHGKTTTTAMMAHILKKAGKHPTVVVGSLLAEGGSNFVAGADDLFVIEGCEYLRHFLHLHPHTLIITNIELDHTDYYKDLADIEHAFQELVARVPDEGVVVANTDLPTVARVLGADKRVHSFQNASVPPLKVRGSFNAENARSAKVACQTLFPDLAEEDIDNALADFRGTWRRFEYKGKTKEGALVYDDYAHHPSEVRATLTMAREAFPEKELVVVFHPHLFSRTRDFMQEFVEALALAHRVYVLPIFAAREAPIVGVSSEALVALVAEKGRGARAIASFEEGKMLLEKEGKDALIITMGAGDVYLLAEMVVREAGR